MSLRPGRPLPLGAVYDGAGVNFALFSREAEQVELCLLEGGKERRLPLPEQTDDVWHGYLPGAKPGLRYGYRVRGPWNPAEGQRFNEKKLLLDPYAKLIDRPIQWNDALFGYAIGKDDLAKDERDSAAYMAWGVVVEGRFSWGRDHAPATPWQETVIYEAHVKGLTKLHPLVPPELRGTYAGLAAKPVLEHLKSLGVTAVELMPVHQKVDDRDLMEQGRRNYWGYNTLSYFAPERSYASRPDDAVAEFKRMVKSLHSAGLEVILDVVYNHTAEGNHHGPTLFLRGIDNRAYYRLSPDRRYYEDFTGCGNTLNMNEPRVLQLIMDSLRYWAVEMRIDGFRFDLASALAREQREVSAFSAFFDIIHQDPVLSRLKLIAEPWDLGEGGYQVGNFPPGWAEWNGLYRDCVRRFWKGEPQTVGELATRLSGSSDLYERRGRKPYASVNFITCHDGLTLEDLAGGSARLKRSLLATLFLSQGVPMLCGGDELGRTQEGNDNAYCDDSERSWTSWELDAEKEGFLSFVRAMAKLRRTQPVLRRRKFLQGRPIRGGKDIAWLTPAGAEMTEADWSEPGRRSLAVLLAGDAVGEQDQRGRAVSGDDLLFLINSGEAPASFTLPSSPRTGRWKRVFDTAAGAPLNGGPYELLGGAVALFRAGAA